MTVATGNAIKKPKKHICEVCGHGLHLKSSLKRHMASKHPTTKPEEKFMNPAGEPLNPPPDSSLDLSPYIAQAMQNPAVRDVVAQAVRDSLNQMNIGDLIQKSAKAVIDQYVAQFQGQATQSQPETATPTNGQTSAAPQQQNLQGILDLIGKFITPPAGGIPNLQPLADVMRAFSDVTKPFLEMQLVGEQRVLNNLVTYARLGHDATPERLEGLRDKVNNDLGSMRGQRIVSKGS